MPTIPHNPLPHMRQQPAPRHSGRLHPAGIILLWLCMAIALQALPETSLLVAACLVLMLSLSLTASRLYTLLRRTRWIMLTLLLVYAYTIPGESLWGAGYLSPTMEGLVAGGLQLLRLVSALAALSIALSVLSRQQLISGIYTLATPLRVVGLSRERLAVRLALTLDYAEAAMRQTAADWRSSIERLHETGDAEAQPLEIPVQAFRLADVGLVLLGAALLVPVLW